MLVKNGHVVDDPYAIIDDKDPVPAGGPIIVSLKRFLAERDALLARTAPLGVRIETVESPESLGGDVQRLALVLLHVPYFKDGRVYSWARLLRTRLGYEGEIRVSGHFLRDQIAFLARVGVDAFQLAGNLSAEDVSAALAEISHVYQPSVDGRPTILDLRRRSGAPGQ